MSLCYIAQGSGTKNAERRSESLTANQCQGLQKRSIVELEAPFQVVQLTLHKQKNASSTHSGHSAQGSCSQSLVPRLKASGPPQNFWEVWIIRSWLRSPKFGVQHLCSKKPSKWFQYRLRLEASGQQSPSQGSFHKWFCMAFPKPMKEGLTLQFFLSRNLCVRKTILCRAT